MENQISIIINGVRYDAVDVDKPYYSTCLHCDEVVNEYCCNSSDDEGLCFIFNLKDKYFKKSDKKLEP